MMPAPRVVANARGILDVDARQRQESTGAGSSIQRLGEENSLVALAELCARCEDVVAEMDAAA